MGFIGKIINQAINDNIREIVTEIFPQYNRVSVQALPPGIDAAPLEEDQGISIIIDKANRSVNIGVYPDAQAEPGEVRIYSRDSGGSIQALLYFKTDGTIEINGTDDFAVRFSKLKEVVDELQGDVTDLKTAFSTWVVAPNDGGAALKASAATWFGTPLTKNIDDAKVETVKLP
jgi:hypothetical protein